MMPLPNRRRALFWIADRKLHAWAILVIGLLLTGAAGLAARNMVEESLDQQFHFRQTEVVAGIRDRIAAYEQVLHGARGLFRASDDVTREEWETYVHSLDLSERYGGIQGIGFAPWVRTSQLDSFEDMVRAEGFPGFQVWPPGIRDAYVPIRLLEPFDLRNRRAFGFDMLSEENRRKALLLARDTGHAAITGKVRLMQETETDVQDGFLMYLPFYGLPRPETAEQRLDRIEGFIFAPFRMRDFMAPVSGELMENLRLQIYSGTEMDEVSLLFDSMEHASPAASAALAENGRRALAELILPGAVWTLQFQTLPGFAPEANRWAPLTIAVVGTLLSLMGFGAIRGAEVVKREQARAAALGQVVEEASTEVYVLDARTLRFLQANRGARANLAYPMDRLREMRLTDIQPDVDRQRFAELTRPLRRGISPLTTYVTRQQRADGSSYEAEVTLQLHRQLSPPVYHALVQDVTERREREDKVAKALAEARGLLAEKETLLREVHHRVKNNLQVIWSLIRLEAGDIADPAVRARLEVVARRIGVLGQIHQQLYGSSDVARVDIGLHVRRLADSIAELHAHQDVTIDVRAAEVTCDLETAIPLGLIANELISNSLEHAFPDGRPGQVVVAVEQHGERVALSVADDGIGEPAGGRELRSGLGLRLVHALAQQLDAEVTVERKNGTRTVVLLGKDAVACAA